MLEATAEIAPRRIVQNRRVRGRFPEPRLRYRNVCLGSANNTAASQASQGTRCQDLSPVYAAKRPASGPADPEYVRRGGGEPTAPASAFTGEGVASAIGAGILGPSRSNHGTAPPRVQEDVMRFRVLAALGLLMVAGPAFAQKVYVDYDKDYKIPADKTFMWQDGPDTLEDQNPLMYSRIKTGI